MAVPNNILQNVITYQPAEMAYLLNSYVALSVANKRFMGFENETAQLGDTMTFQLPQRATTSYGLVASPVQTQQRFMKIACTQAINSAYAFDAKQFIYNVQDYMPQFGIPRIKEIGAKIETDILRNITGSVVIRDPQNPLNGTLADPTSGPYRFYGDGVTPIDSPQQLAQAVANFRNYGAADYDTIGILPDVNIPQIIGNGLKEFAIRRNDEYALKWQLGTFAECDWNISNLLPRFIAGSIGQAALPLTLVSTNDPLGNNITQLTVSSSLISDSNALVVGDLLQFNVPGLVYLNWIGHEPSDQKVQIKCISNSGSDGSGTITFDIYPALQSTPGLNQNLSTALTPGMVLSVLPSRRCGLIMSGRPLYLAMPKMPDEDPFSSSTFTDEESGISIRNYWGAKFGENTRLYVYDGLWGSSLVPENCMQLAFPLT